MRGDRRESSIGGPEPYPIELRGAEQVGIYPADSSPGQCVHVHVTYDFLMPGIRNTRQTFEQGKELGAVSQVSERHLADHERVTRDETVAEQRRKPGIAVAKMIHPDGRIDEDGHRAIWYATGAAAAPASVVRCRPAPRVCARSHGQ